MISSLLLASAPWGRTLAARIIPPTKMTIIPDDSKVQIIFPPSGRTGP